MKETLLILGMDAKTEWMRFATVGAERGSCELLLRGLGGGAAREGRREPGVRGASDWYTAGTTGTGGAGVGVGLEDMRGEGWWWWWWEWE